MDARAAVASARSLAEVARQIWRLLRVLIQEVLGFLFLCFAALGLFNLIRVFRRFQGAGDDVFRMVLLTILVVMMGLCGLSSFRRARRISRGK
jgi:hypothetical protein